MELVEGSDLDSLIRSWEYPLESPHFKPFETFSFKCAEHWNTSTHKESSIEI